MPIKDAVVMEKKERKTPGKRAPLHLATAHAATLNPAMIGASPEQTAAFDPRLFLTKFATGKSRQEYQADESVFSQGNAADAVFYLQSG
jgi:hypothetical protein